MIETTRDLRICLFIEHYIFWTIVCVRVIFAAQFYALYLTICSSESDFTIGSWTS